MESSLQRSKYSRGKVELQIVFLLSGVYPTLRSRFKISAIVERQHYRFQYSLSNIIGNAQDFPMCQVVSASSIKVLENWRNLDANFNRDKFNPDSAQNDLAPV